MKSYDALRDLAIASSQNFVDIETLSDGTDPLYAQRSATKQYRTTPLRALWQRAPYFHDGSAPTLDAVVNHYNAQFGLGLTAKQKADLVEYLKSL